MHNGEAWNAGDIADAIKEAFRQMPNAAIWVGNRNQHLTAGPASVIIPSETWDIMAFAGTVLGQGSEEHRALLLWARIAAQTGHDLASTRETARILSVDASTIFRRRKRACERIARAKNDADRRIAQLSHVDPLDSAIDGAGSTRTPEEQLGS